MDPLLHHLPDRPGRICSFGCILQHSHGSRVVGSRLGPQLCGICLWICYRMDELCGRLHCLPAGELVWSEILCLDVCRTHLSSLLHRDARARRHDCFSQHSSIRRWLQYGWNRWTACRSALSTTWSVWTILSRRSCPLDHRQQLPQHLQRDVFITGHGPLDAKRPALHLDICRDVDILRNCDSRI